MKAPGKAAQDQVGKAFNFQLLTDKGTRREGGECKDWEKEEEGAKRDKENR